MGNIRGLCPVESLWLRTEPRELAAVLPWARMIGSRRSSTNDRVAPGENEQERLQAEYPDQNAVASGGEVFAD